MIVEKVQLVLAIAMLAVFGPLNISTQMVLGQTQDAPPPPKNIQYAHAIAPATRPLSQLAPGEKRIAITFTGGHDTDPRDHGRPVTLIAAALKVPENVFRETFTHVHPAAPGSGGPTDAEARQNKAALMAGLSPYGVTDDRLNTVSNYYRYMKHNPSDLWQHRDAIAYAIVKNNQITRFDIVDAGAGYTTPPAAKIDVFAESKIIAKLSFGTDLPTNGSISSLSAGK